MKLRLPFLCRVWRHRWAVIETAPWLECCGRSGCGLTRLRD